MQSDIKTTGNLRTILAKAAQDVVSGELEVERAKTLHKLAKNITESLYSETKIAIFRNESGQKAEAFGALSLGDPSDA